MALPVPPERDAENHAHVVQVAVGAQHALLLTDEGIVYSWGASNQYGQLGRTPVSQDQEQEPSPIIDVLYKGREKEVIVQIACGSNHCLALSQKGKLFAWGYNKAGQLGFEGFNPNAQQAQLIQKAPREVTFPGQADVQVRSCSCGPESSACVTSRGEVYVWGAISYYLFGNGTKYDKGDNCTVPVKVRGVPKSGPQFAPDQVCLHRHKFACTLARAHASDELQNLMGTLKNRGNFYSKVVRNAKKDAGDRTPGDDDDFEREELRLLDSEFRNELKSCEQKLKEIDEGLERCRAELSRVGRELTICDQQDTALTEAASNLEARRSENTGVQGSQDDARKKALETQLSDIRYFRRSNKRNRLQLLSERDRLEQALLHHTQDQIAVTQKKQEVEGRAKLIRSLQKGGLGKGGKSSIDDGIDIAMNKREELAATECQTLAGAGKFTGFREVVAIADRALQDVSSALKEVSGAVKGSEAVGIVEALEANLKLRKDLKSAIQERLHRAERGRPQNSPLGFCPGMVDFFKEASAAAIESKESSR